MRCSVFTKEFYSVTFYVNIILASIVLLDWIGITEIVGLPYIKSKSAID